jgi:hypothetical protein
MHRLKLATVALGLLLLSSVGASAEFLSVGSSIGWTGNYRPEDGAGNAVSLGTATHIDFFPNGTGGTAQTSIFVPPSGDLATIPLGTIGTIKDLALVNSPVADFVSFSFTDSSSVTHTFSLDLNSVMIEAQSDAGLVLYGSATLKYVPGYDPTPGSYSLSFNTTNGFTDGRFFEFTFSSNAAAIPEPATLGLFGTALLGLGLLGRGRRRVA